MKRCPFCKQEILEIAKKCPYCTRVLIEEIYPSPQRDWTSEGTKTINIDATEESPVRETPTPAKRTSPKPKWYYRKWFVTLMLFLYTPVGITLLWAGSVFRQGIRIGLTIVFGLTWLGNIISRGVAEFYKPPWQTMYETMYSKPSGEIFLPQIEREGKKDLHISEKRHPNRLSVSEIAKNQKSVVLIETRDKFGRSIGQGSGFVICKNGFIVTNYHVLENGYSATIKFIDGSTYDNVSLVAKDREKDLTIIKVPSRKSLPFLYLGNSDKVRVGDIIVAIGNPLGYEGTVSDGRISAIRERKGIKYFQITAPISPGSSGGPLFNIYGEVIGITTAFAPFGQNLNFAIPINYLKLLAKEGPPFVPVEEKKTTNLKLTTPKIPITKKTYTSLPTGTKIGSYYTREGQGQLKIDNGTNLDAVVKLVNLSTNRSIYSVYIKSKDIYWIKNIPNGRYKLLFSLGKDWDSESKKFLQFRTFSKFQDNLNFVTRETISQDRILTEYTVFEVTLHPIPGGKAKTEDISEAEFDLY